MKFKRKPPAGRVPRDAERLLAMVRAELESSSRIERGYWRNALEALAEKLVLSGHDGVFEAAIGGPETFRANPELDATPQELVAALAESVSECATFEQDGTRWDAVLVSIPVIAWSKYSVPSGPITDHSLLNATLAHLHAHVLASNAKSCLLPFLYSLDDLPRTWSAVRKLLDQSALRAIQQQPSKEKFPKREEGFEDLLADTLFILAAVVVPAGEPVFHWQETTANGDFVSRSEAADRWHAQASDAIARMLPGCTVECGLPQSFFEACRFADRAIRAPSIRAGVAFIENTLHLAPGQLRAVIAAVGETNVDEYRVSLLLRNAPEVLHGVVWPLYGNEDEYAQADAPPPIEQIRAVLRDCKVTDITTLDQRIAPDFCEDCGAPLFADHEAEMVHAEMPEEAGHAPTHYH